jgi:hypothetical protein
MAMLQFSIAMSGHFGKLNLDPKQIITPGF